PQAHAAQGASPRPPRPRSELLGLTPNGPQAHAQGASRFDLRGKTCVELGSGWVLSHALLLWLLGAERVIATDLEAQAHPETLKVAVRKAVSSVVRDSLSPFEDHGLLRARLERLRAIERFDFATLRALGIEYRAPLDLAREGLGEPVDVVFSWSVLEHVPAVDVDPLLQNLARDLRPGGVMLHAIHLEDHRDSARAPFAFLAPDPSFGPRAQSERGNRIRRSGWEARCAELEGLSTEVLYAWQRDAALLPAAIDPEVAHTGPEDLRTSHLGLCLRRASG
ncbi:MAG: hypothetical protein KDD82_14010, partial [Planctomycetes bacterium]|nr:hypothetical protein [Planctomycetota bacterium]